VRLYDDAFVAYPIKGGKGRKYKKGKGNSRPWDASTRTLQCTRSRPTQADSTQQTVDSRQQRESERQKTEDSRRQTGHIGVLPA
jgi:hypothetical protein